MPSTNRAAFSSREIVTLRSAKNVVDPHRPYAFLTEKERSAAGIVEDVATVFLTNKECPFRCLFCDLWKNTTDHTVPVGAIAEQIRWALAQLPAARVIKLYNSGNFFDPAAIPKRDYAAIADIVRPFDKVIVESHPAMVGRLCFDFHALVGDRLQVAMGLETANVGVLARLNKQMTLDDYERAAAALLRRGIDVRAFILLRPPFLDEQEGVIWAKHTIDFAFNIGVECSVVIPTRSGNGAMNVLAERGEFHPPRLESLKEVLEYGIGLRRGRVFADLWDIEALAGSDGRRQESIARLHEMNLTGHCGAE